MFVAISQSASIIVLYTCLFEIYATHNPSAQTILPVPIPIPLMCLHHDILKLLALPCFEPFLFGPTVPPPVVPGGDIGLLRLVDLADWCAIPVLVYGADLAHQ